MGVLECLQCNLRLICNSKGVSFFTHPVKGIPKKRLPFEVKRKCRMFEFECFKSLMSPRMRKSIRNAYIKIFSSNI